jgi:hypothetical protein
LRNDSGNHRDIVDKPPYCLGNSTAHEYQMGRDVASLFSNHSHIQALDKGKDFIYNEPEKT